MMPFSQVQLIDYRRLFIYEGRNQVDGKLFIPLCCLFSNLCHGSHVCGRIIVSRFYFSVMERKARSMTENKGIPTKLLDVFFSISVVSFLVLGWLD